MLIIQIFKSFFLKRKVKRFFSSNYRERVYLKKKEFSNDKHLDRMKEYFQENFKELESTQIFNDISYSICKTSKPKQIHQLGCFTCHDSRFLIKKKIKAKFINSDFDEQRVNFLRNKFKKLNFKTLDLENSLPNDFKRDDVVLGNAVFTNIQPEKIRILIKNIFSSKVKFLIIGDVYNKESLKVDKSSKSIPLNSETNYFHPFISLSKQLNLKSFFIPDFSYTSYTVARGVFIFCKNKNNLLKSLDYALSSFLKRQENVLKTYSTTNINQHWRKNERNN